MDWPQRARLSAGREEDERNISFPVPAWPEGQQAGKMERQKNLLSGLWGRFILQVSLPHEEKMCVPELGAMCEQRPVFLSLTLDGLSHEEIRRLGQYERIGTQPADWCCEAAQIPRAQLVV